MQFERLKVDKKQTYMKTETLYSSVFWIFLPNIINFDLWNGVAVHYKDGWRVVFFETQCSN